MAVRLTRFEREPVLFDPSRGAAALVREIGAHKTRHAFADQHFLPGDEVAPVMAGIDGTRTPRAHAGIEIEVDAPGPYGPREPDILLLSRKDAVAAPAVFVVGRRSARARRD